VSETSSTIRRYSHRSVAARFAGPRSGSVTRTTFSGDFTRVFTYSPIGPVEPTGEHLEWEVIGTFRYDDDGRLAEEWVQTDYRSFLTKLGVTTTESAERRRS
jgi:hypothetical protein